MRALIQNRSIALLSGVLCCLVSGCLFDPDPGPDSTETSTGGDGDSDADEADAGAGMDAESPDAPPLYFFVSAPDKAGQVTVVGTVPEVSEAWDTGEIVVGFNGRENMVIDVSESGSFAFRLDAADVDTLWFAPTDDALGTLEGNQFEFEITRNDAESVGNRLLGVDGSVTAPEAGMVRIQGRGELLRAGVTVIAGNVTGSSSARAEVVCNPNCAFDLLILGETGDEIDLFLYAPAGAAGLEAILDEAGFTDTQTVVVP